MNQSTNTEFEAFRAVHDALARLDDEARRRVVKSAITLLGIDAHLQSAPEVDEDVDDDAAQAAAAIEANKGTQSFSTFAELDAAFA